VLGKLKFAHSDGYFCPPGQGIGVSGRNQKFFSRSLCVALLSAPHACDYLNVRELLLDAREGNCVWSLSVPCIRGSGEFSFGVLGQRKTNPYIYAGSDTCYMLSRPGLVPYLTKLTRSAFFSNPRDESRSGGLFFCQDSGPNDPLITRSDFWSTACSLSISGPVFRQNREAGILFFSD